MTGILDLALGCRGCGRGGGRARLQRVVWLLLWCLPVLTFGAPGDYVIVTLKGGQVVEGRIVSEDDASVTVETSLAEIPLSRSKIEKIEISWKGDNQEGPHRARMLHTQAQSAYQRQKYLEALRLALEALKEGHDNPVLPRVLIRQSTDQLIRQLSAQTKAGDHSTAIVTGIKLEEMSVTREFVSAFDSQAVFDAMRLEAGGILGEAYLGRAKALQLRKDMNQAAAIRSDLDSAIRYAGETSQTGLHAMYHKALLLEELGDLANALQLALRAKERLEDTEYRRLCDELERRVRSKIQAAQDNQQTASAQPVNNRPLPVSAPPVQPLPPVEVQDTWLNKVENFMNQRGWTSAIWHYFVVFIDGGYWRWVALLAAAYLLIWKIPSWFIERRMRRGDFKAAEKRQAVRRFGVFGLVGYFRGRAEEARHTKRCPHCDASLEGIEDYKNFRFDLCPNCGSDIEPIYSMNDYIEKLVKSMDGLSPDSSLPAGQRIVVKDAMTKLVRSIISMAVQARATDLHIEPVTDHLKFRARVDGMLFDLSQLPSRLAPNIVNSLKIMANLDIAERRVPQDGNFALWVDGQDIDIRVSTSPVANGESVSLRLLDHRAIDVEPSMLGFEEDNLAKFTKTIMSPHGLILVTGPSGSGKSTTLYVALRTLNTGEKNIITIEDPVEYKIKGVNQSQINPAADFTFATALRSMLRQDPDVIMVGEIRDRDTAQLAIDASLTGHLVLTTLHTVDSSGAVPRLADLGCDPSRLSVCLLSVIAQRLVRLNCTECVAPYSPTPSLLEDLEMPLPSDELKYYKGRGCARCKQSGYYGRTGIFEILMPNDKIRDAIEKRMTSLTLREMSCNAGMRTLREEGLLKIIQGKTTLEEILRVTSTN